MITLEIDGPIAHIKLDRAQKLNAMNWAFWEGMPGIIEQINTNLDIRAAVLWGEGKAFSVGLDFFDVMPRLGVMGTGPDGERQRKLHQIIRDMQWAVTSVERCRVPVIAAVHGYCLGGGIDLITACDFRLAAKDAVFGIRETKMALVADIGTLQRLPRVIAPGIARELVYTGRDFNADYAAEIGLVNRILPDRDAVIAEAVSVAREIAANAPLAVQGSKQTLNAAVIADIDRELEYVATYNAAHLVTQDLMHAIECFATKQTPEFKGK
ncbi:MAG TPA: crotonase/enoyl-CoA hydratase family protein [Myxococcales bacterium]|nr:crotonase/enoyl-CoA hydratase family protein [Myxococcales bacterium]